MNEIMSKLKEFIIAELNIGKDIELTEETELIEIGVDSIALMTLLVFVEEEFGFEVEEDILLENKFYNMGDIAKYIHTTVNR